MSQASFLACLLPDTTRVRTLVAASVPRKTISSPRSPRKPSRLPYSVEYGVLRVLSKEVAYQIEIDELKKELSNRISCDYGRIF